MNLSKKGGFCLLLYILITAISCNNTPSIDIIDFSKNRDIKFTYFFNGHLEKERYPFKIVTIDNITAGEIVRASDANVWSGMYTLLDTPVNLEECNIFSIDVWMDHLGTFTLKLEGSTNGGQNSSISVKNKKINTWETLTFDFKDVIFDSPTYSKIVLFVDLNAKVTGKDVTSYFANIKQQINNQPIKKTGNPSDAVKIVVLGSSTAAGTGPADTKNAWVNRFRTKMQTINDYHEVINLAVGGYTTYQLLPNGTVVPDNRPKPDTFHNVTKALSLQPDAVLINLPSNDANLGYTIMEQMDNYQKICQTLDEAQIPFWISTPQGRNMEKVKRQVQLILRDSTYRRFGRRTLDFWKGIAHWDGTIHPEYDSGDGIHLNDEAHRILFEKAWAKNIVGYLQDRKNNIQRSETAYTSPLERLDYELTWVDDFSGAELNKAHWTHDLGNGCPTLCDWGNREKVWYRSENSQIKDGNLVITARKDHENKGYWSSSRINTKHKVEFHFGRLDIRAKLPKTKGLWPAIWLLGVNRTEVGWPACGEIDIMELVGHIPYQVFGTVHYEGENGKAKQIGSNFELLYNDFSDDFHVFSIDWDKEGIRYYVDDQLYSERLYNELNLTEVKNPFVKPFYLILNCAVGGNLSGYPDETSIFPQTFKVDYIRYFQKKI